LIFVDEDGVDEDGVDKGGDGASNGAVEQKKTRD
jgi:hypothetical protein